MKKVIAVILAMAVMFGLTMYIEHNYTLEDCEVIGKNDGVLGLIDADEQVWIWEAVEQHEYDFYNSVEVGDELDIKLFDNFTSQHLSDDIIKELVRD